MAEGIRDPLALSTEVVGGYSGKDARVHVMSGSTFTFGRSEPMTGMVRRLLISYAVSSLPQHENPVIQVMQGVSVSQFLP